MKLSLEWLNEFVDLENISNEKLISKINTSICEIDKIEEYFEHINHIIVSKVLKIEKHPNADKLVICDVFDGKDSYQVITGAKNLQENDFVPLAKVGTYVMGNKIEKTKLRDIESKGMLCSEKELDFSEEHSGIMVLKNAQDKDLGKNLREFLNLKDKILHIDNKSITHRPDLWSHFGFARELASQFKKKIRFSPLDSEFQFSTEQKLEVIENKNAHSYYASFVENLHISSSTQKIKNRLNKCGVRSINNLVDITNYVLLEIGQPSHFFDADLLEKISLEVDFAKENETIELLDESTQKLEPDILLIRNHKTPVAIAGVMGGQKTAVSNKTTKIVMESGVFKREFIRKSIQKTGIRSESSIRYEKGLDSHTTLPTIKRALNLIKENYCPDLIAYAPQGFDHSQEKTVKIKSSISFLNQKLGKKFEKSEILDILQRLNFTILHQEEDNFELRVPKFRHNYDITIEEDLVEEIGRTVGYDNLPISPFIRSVQPPVQNENRKTERNLKQFFANILKYQEIYGYSFASKEDNLIEKSTLSSIEIKNDMPKSSAYMRLSLYPSLLKSIQFNLDRFDEVKFFEFGKSYFEQEKPREATFLAFANAINIRLSDKNLKKTEEKFIEERNQFESIFNFFHLKNWNATAIKDSSFFHPNCALKFEINDKILAEIGLVHPKHLDKYGINKRVFAGKIYFANFQACIKKAQISFSTPSSYPNSQLDICFILEKTEKTEIYLSLVKIANIPEIKEMFLNEIYEGSNIGESKKAVSYRFYLLNETENLTQQRIKEITDQLVEIGEKNHFKLRRF